MKPRIIVETPMALLTLEQQEEVWRLSRTNDVFEKDINGELWQVIDMSNGQEESDNLLVKSDKTKITRITD